MLPTLVKTRRFEDGRGWFAESYNAARFAEIGISDRFVQDNHSRSGPIATLRGLHFQHPPHAQGKLVRCIAGRIWDVVVDLRRNSPTFGGWTAVELTAEGGDQLYVPVGFAHGFVTLEEETEVLYKTSDYYAPASEGAVVWNDPELAIAWPQAGRPVLSDKDAAAPCLSAIVSDFDYDGYPLAGIREVQL